MIPTVNRQEVTVVDVSMPFLSMVIFMVKWAIASIPALLLLMGIFAVFWGATLGFVSSLFNPNRGSGSDRSSLAEPSSVSPTNKLTSTPNNDEAAYISQVSIRNVKVGPELRGQFGAFGEIKNDGNRTLERVQITIYCLNSEGKPIFEQTYAPVLASSSISREQPLKAGYSRQFGVRVDDVPSDWAKKVDVKVTSISFESRVQ